MSQIQSNHNKIKLETSILILRNWDSLRQEHQSVKSFLENLPKDLNVLDSHRSKLYLLDKHNEEILEKDLKEVTQKLDFYLPHLLKLSQSLKNAIALQERIEIIRADSFVSFSANEIASDLAPSSQVLKKLTLLQRISKFRAQSPENFWSILIAILLFLVIVWQGQPTPVSNLSASYYTTETGVTY